MGVGKGRRGKGRGEERQVQQWRGQAGTVSRCLPLEAAGTEGNLLGLRGKEAGGLAAGVVLSSSARHPPTSSRPVPPAIRSGLKAGVQSLIPYTSLT